MMAHQIEQFEYTSCMYSLNGDHAGFKVRTQSQGLLPTQCSAALTGLAYVAPFRSRAEPGSATRGPTNYTYRPLDATSVLVGLVSDAEADHTGRSGNFFVHALVAPVETIAVSPGAWLDWRGWRKGLAAGDDTRQPAPLAVLTGDEVSGRRSVVDIELAELTRAITFFNARPGRTVLAAKALATLALNANTGRTVIVRDVSGNLVDWIRSLQAIPPWKLIRSITVSSYAAGPSNVDLQGILANEPDHEWKGLIASGAARLIDPTDQGAGPDPSVEVLGEDNAEVFRRIEQFYIKSFARGAADIAAFNRSVLVNFKIDRFDSGFAEVIAAQAFLQAASLPIGSGSDASSFGARTLAVQMAHLEKFANPAAVPAAIAAVEQMRKRLPPKDLTSLWPKLAVFLANMANLGQSKDTARQAADVWINDFKTRGLSGGQHLQSSLDAYQSLVQFLPELAPSLSSRFLDTLAGLAAPAPTLDAEGASLLLTRAAAVAKPQQANEVDPRFWQAAVVLGRLASETTKGIGPVLMELLTPTELALFHAHLQTAVGDERARRSVAVDYLKTGEALSSTRLEFYRSSIEGDAGEAFVAAWEHRLFHSNEPLVDFANFEKLLETMPATVAETVRFRSGPELPRWLSANLLNKTAKRWLCEGKGGFLSSDVASRAIIQLNTETRLKQFFDEQTLRDTLTKAARHFQINLVPDKASLAVQIAGFSPHLGLPTSLLKDVATLDRQDQAFALQELLCATLIFARNGREHGEVVDQFVDGGIDPSNLEPAHFAALTRLSESPVALVAATEAALDQAAHNADVSGSFADAVREVLAKRSSRQTYKAYLSEMASRSRRYDSQRYYSWSDFQDMLDDERKGMIGRLVRGISRWFSQRAPRD